MAEPPICLTCGVQYDQPRPACPICEDERQYVGWGGQRWTTLADLRADGWHTRIEPEGPDVIGVGTAPAVGIGQRALLVRTETGNVLWDCIGFLDDEIVGRIRELGGISAIAISHPHFYGTMIEWSRAFDAPVFLHEADRQWVGRPDPAIEYWSGDTREIGPGLTLINAGIHFTGGTVLHWSGGDDGRGVLFSGDIFQVVMDRRWLSFMHSYPNLIPERPSVIRRALRLMEPFAFDRIYGAFWHRNIDTDGPAALHRSADRYLRHALDAP